MSKDMDYLPNVLRSLLKRNKLTQSMLAELVDVSKDDISNYCKGVVYPSLKVRSDISDLFGITVEELGKKQPKIKTHVVDNIKFLMLSNNMSQFKFAETIGVNHSLISKYISGSLKPSEGSILKIAQTFNIDTKVIIEKDIATLKKNGKYIPVYWNAPEKDNTKPIEKHVVTSPSIKPHIIQVCTKCMYEDGLEVLIDSGISYLAVTIQKWARKSICQMTDRYSEKYNPERADMLSDMLFRYFINKKKPINPQANYFVREKNGELFLRRDNSIRY